MEQKDRRIKPILGDCGSINDIAFDINELLINLGQTDNVGKLRDGVKETPYRVAKFWEEFLNPEPFTIKTFDAEQYDEMIISKDIPFYSVCEHHMVPFFGSAIIAYIPGDAGKIIGISKMPRILDYFARRLQNQERITKQIADLMDETLKPKGVAVILRARHLCQEMRGIKKQAETTTSAMRGVFRDDPAVRAEVLNLIK